MVSVRPKDMWDARFLPPFPPLRCQTPITRNPDARAAVASPWSWVAMTRSAPRSSFQSKAVDR